MKKKLVIWGGWWGKDTPLSLETINSHASVSAYFLTKYLSEFYDIVNIYDFYSAEGILDYKDAIAVISTFQYGFTKLIEKGKKNEYERIRKNFKGKLCSLTDCTYIRKSWKYKENILFTVNPPGTTIILKLVKKNIIVKRYGWSAEPKICSPEPVPNNQVNIFVDHSWYRACKWDWSSHYFNAFKDIVNMYPDISFNVYRQNNDGVVEWNLSSRFDEQGYLRTSKVSHKEILDYYKKCHIFCVTHPESAGQAAIEAAMCGAKLYVPISPFRPYIQQGLLNDGVECTCIPCRVSRNPIKWLKWRDPENIRNEIVSSLKRDIEKGFDRNKTHSRLLEKNTWKAAASRMHKVLSERA